MLRVQAKLRIRLVRFWATTLCGRSFPIKRQNFAANKIKEDDDDDDEEKRTMNAKDDEVDDEYNGRHGVGSC